MAFLFNFEKRGVFVKSNQFIVSYGSLSDG